VKTRERLDKIIVDRGLVRSRERARALIMEGKISVNGAKAEKAGTMVGQDDEISLKEDIPYVSRGGLKLESALDFFGVDPAGKVVMDIGCSTGGFTDCVLKRSARKVYAVDVGYGQFDWSLRKDPRVVLLEKTNIRYLDREMIPDPVDLAVIDVSFISLLNVLPKVLDFLGEAGEVLALVKPQFEVGKGMVGKGGIVREEARRLAAAEGVKEGAEKAGYESRGLYECPVRGQKGNVEYFFFFGRKSWKMP
jgi:23S rRNA (cytidine1920-2'-O)/16S rRNA (cytidine1409-2'-O)-methyltransferase